MPSCIRDEGRSLGIGLQDQVPNHRKLLRSRALVVSVPAKGWPRAGQVRARKTSASEPLMRRRKHKDVIKTRLQSLAWDQSRRHLLTALTMTGVKVA